MAVHMPAMPGATLLLLTGVLAVAVPTAVLRHADVTASSSGVNGTGTVTGSSSTPSGTSAASGSSGASGKAAPDKPAKDDKGVFAISGSVAGLVPGVAKPMVVTVTNPNGYSIQVMSISATAGSTGDAQCPAAALSVAPYEYSSGPGVVAPSKSTTTLTLSVLLADSLTVDTSGCPGTTFPLSFTGTAEKGK
jgi:hypothetical protein